MSEQELARRVIEGLRAENAQLRQQLEENAASALRQLSERETDLQSLVARLQTVEGERDGLREELRDVNGWKARAELNYIALQAAQRENGVLRDRINKLRDAMEACRHGFVAILPRWTDPQYDAFMAALSNIGKGLMADNSARVALSAPASPAATVQPCPLPLPHDCDRAVHAAPAKNPPGLYTFGSPPSPAAPVQGCTNCDGGSHWPCSGCVPPTPPTSARPSGVEAGEREARRRQEQVDTWYQAGRESALDAVEREVKRPPYPLSPDGTQWLIDCLARLRGGAR